MTRSKFKRIQRLKKTFYERFKSVCINAEAGRLSTTELVLMVFNFCQLLSGINMYPYQEQFAKRLIRSVLENDGEEITALFARQSGKSETVSTTTGGMMVILPKLANMPMFADDPRLEIFKSGLWVGIFAPSQRQASITYNRIRARISGTSAQAILNDPEFALSFTISNGQTVALSNGSFATAISASEGSNIEGESFKLIVCEETQDISNFKIRKSIHPMGAAYNASIIKIGTATNHKGDFYEAIQRNRRDLELRKQKNTDYMRRNHFEYGWKVVSKFNPKYAAYIQKEIKRLGEKSDEFQMSYNLRWILERGMFIDIEVFEKNNLEFSLDTSLYDTFSTHVAGVDVGGKGSDSTVVTITEVNWDMPVIEERRTNEETGEEETYYAFNTYIKAWLEIRGTPDYEEQYHLIMDFLSHYKIARVVVDTTRESAIADRMRANSNYEVVSFVFTSKAKSVLYKTLDREIVSGRARVPAGEATINSPEYLHFIEQMADLQKGYSGANMVVSHPSEGNAHDDFPDSWALAVWGCCTRGEVIEVSSSSSSFFAKFTQNESKFARAVNQITAMRR